MTRARIFLAALSAGILVLAVCLVRHPGNAVTGSELARRTRIVSVLELTDLSIWTEARFTRHPSQADFFSAFQESPGSLDHFPAGSVLSPSRAR
jgi:hypothetical protein